MMMPEIRATKYKGTDHPHDPRAPLRSERQAGGTVHDIDEFRQIGWLALIDGEITIGFRVAVHVCAAPRGCQVMRCDTWSPSPRCKVKSARASGRAGQRLRQQCIGGA